MLPGLVVGFVRRLSERTVDFPFRAVGLNLFSVASLFEIVHLGRTLFGSILCQTLKMMPNGTVPFGSILKIMPNGTVPFGRILLFLWVKSFFCRIWVGI